MSTPVLSPACDQLSDEQAAHRLASHMFSGFKDGHAVALLKGYVNERERIPGYCVICGNKLPVTWRAIRCDEPPSPTYPNGKFFMVEADHSPESLAKVKQFNDKYPEGDLSARARELLRSSEEPRGKRGMTSTAAMGDGLQNGFLNQPVTHCEKLSEACFKRARQILQEQHAQAKVDEKKQASGGTKASHSLVKLPYRDD